jgi:hypothetical protein
MDTIYTFGIFFENSTDYLVNNIINLYYFYYKFKHLKVENIHQHDIQNLNEINYLLNNGKLNENRVLLVKHFIEYKYSESINFNLFVHLYKNIYIIFNFPIKKIILEPINNIDRSSIVYSYDVINNNEKPQLILRTGIIELFAVNSVLYGDKNIIRKALNNIIKNKNNENYMYDQNRPCWMTTIHNLHSYEVYLKMLMTNAGFYIDNNLDSAYNNLLFFTNNYKEGIINSNYLMDWDFLNFYYFDILNEKKLHNSIKLFNFNPEYIYNILNNKSILFVTPFKDKIDKIYNSGNIYKINKNVNFTNINLITIESFLTTYPNTKHNNFKETFDYYCNEIDKKVSENNINIFTCSSGCYGIPLCNYVYKKHNITSIYIGHTINHYFGIISSRDDIHDNINSEFCEISDLNIRYKNIEKIESNMYGYNK